MKQRPHAHARSDVVESRWDEATGTGYWKFRCQSCGHLWEEAAVHTQKPLVGQRFGKHAWAMFARYWSEKGGGVKTPCPACGAGSDKPKTKPRRPSPLRSR